MSVRKAEPNPAHRALVRLASLGLLLLGWSALAVGVADPETLPGPIFVAGLIVREILDGALLYHVAVTLARVAAAFFLAMSIGLAIGLFMGRRPAADRWLDPWLVVFLNLPALVTIVLCYLWIGLTEVAAILAVAINKIPMVTVLIREGARAFDPALSDMASVFRMPPGKRLRHVILPQLAPYVAASARTGTALIWKIVLVVEFLGRSNGVGFQIHLYFQLFDVPMVLAYALAFIMVMLAVEAFILQPWETAANRWRRA
ncbi:MAG: ABC transporter permease subunit [Roseibium sp.]|nr:ABC transporter permease subunit [Roseibium sp.]